MTCFFVSIYASVERDKKVHEEKRYEKSIEVDQKTKQIGLERNAVDQILTISIPGALEKAGFALKSVTLKDIEVEIINNNPVPEAIQVSCVVVTWCIAIQLPVSRRVFYAGNELLLNFIHLFKIYGKTSGTNAAGCYPKGHCPSIM